MGIPKGGGRDFPRKECQTIFLIIMDTSNKGEKGMRNDALGKHRSTQGGREPSLQQMGEVFLLSVSHPTQQAHSSQPSWIW